MFYLQAEGRYSLQFCAGSLFDFTNIIDCRIDSHLQLPKVYAEIHRTLRFVALLIKTSNEYARVLLRGILRYQQKHQRWILDLSEQQRGATPPEWIRSYSGDGIIVRIENAQIARAIKSTQLPVIDVSAARQIPEIPWLETDDVLFHSWLWSTLFQG